MHVTTDDEAAWLDEALKKYCETRDRPLRDEILATTDWLASRGARRYADRGEPFDDLVQVARIGLVKALERFDPAFSVQFSAYATPTIMGELRRHFRDFAWSVKVPRRAKDLRQAVNVAREELEKELGQAATISQIADRLRVSEDLVLEALEANNAYRSTSLDPTRADHSPTVEPEVDFVLDREMVARLLNSLGPREQKILRLRFFDELTQSEIADQIGTSQVHVGRLIASSLEQLRAKFDQ